MTSLSTELGTNAGSSRPCSSSSSTSVAGSRSHGPDVPATAASIASCRRRLSCSARRLSASVGMRWRSMSALTLRVHAATRVGACAPPSSIKVALSASKKSAWTARAKKRRAKAGGEHLLARGMNNKMASKQARERNSQQLLAGAGLLPIEAVQALREVVAAKSSPATASAVHSMDARRIVHRIIKDEAAEKRLHVLATARRFHYCFPVAREEPEPPAI